MRQPCRSSGSVVSRVGVGRSNGRVVGARRRPGRAPGGAGGDVAPGHFGAVCTTHQSCRSSQARHPLHVELPVEGPSVSPGPRSPIPSICFTCGGFTASLLSHATQRFEKPVRYRLGGDLGVVAVLVLAVDAFMRAPLAEYVRPARARCLARDSRQPRAPRHVTASEQPHRRATQAARRSGSGAARS
eukprot:7381665-Prymnesium_polylepis.1